MWRVSLGGILIFAAGMMVGFAPMRAWLFFRDEPKFVEIGVIVFDVDASEADEVRRAFSETPSKDAAREADPVQVLASRAPSRRILSKPTIMTMMDREARLQMVDQPFPRASGSPPAGYPDVIEASFTPSVRSSGKLELQCRVKHTSTRSDQAGKPLGTNQVGTESSMVVDNGVWRLIEVGSLSGSDVDKGRRRCLLLRVQPVESMR